MLAFFGGWKKFEKNIPTKWWCKNGDEFDGIESVKNHQKHKHLAILLCPFLGMVSENVTLTQRLESWPPTNLAMKRSRLESPGINWLAINWDGNHQIFTWLPWVGNPPNLPPSNPSDIPWDPDWLMTGSLYWLVKDNPLIWLGIVFHPLYLSPRKTRVEIEHCSPLYCTTLIKDSRPENPGLASLPPVEAVAPARRGLGGKWMAGSG